MTRRRLPLTVLAIASCVASASASEPLTITPSAFHLRGPESVQQVAVSTPSGREPSSLVYSIANPKVAVVDSTGLVVPTGDGSTELTVRSEDSTATARVSVRDFATPPPVHFANHVVPIFTKLGCNSGGCHGKASGQNGFRLSLLGFVPEFDYESLVNEGRGRRVFPAAPERSLLLTKATAQVPHGGGRKIAVGSRDDLVIRRWIAAGMPVGASEAPTVAKIVIEPAQATLSRGEARQILATAVYTDGSTEDVTRFAQYQTNDPDLLVATETGRVSARQLAGQAAIMARYQGKVAVFRATVPTGDGAPDLGSFRPATILDDLAVTKWKALGIAPSQPCTDAEFIRRASLDITGTLPTPDFVKSYVADASPDKAAKLVDRLLESPAYSAYFATKWGDILRNKREGNAGFQAGTYRFHDWIKQSLERNVPYDKFARSILTSTGPAGSSPPSVWYRHIKTPEQFADETAQVFLGTRLQCARCHHHPFESWSQDDYFGFAGFMARVQKKPLAEGQRSGRADFAVVVARAGEVYHPRTGKVVPPKPPGGATPTLAPGDDPRVALANWMSDPKNPFFARSLVNRYWAHFFGRGLCEPIDDLRVTNPPADPETLDALADAFVRLGYDLKALIRLICTSRVYALSSVPTPSNAADRQSFARHYPKRMTAEVLLDGIAGVTGTPPVFAGLPLGTRAIELPDESVGTSFLDAFGRPKRDTPCECERVSDAGLAQSLVLLNSPEVQQKVADEKGQAAKLAADPRPDAEKVEGLFLAAFGRPPSSSETAAAVNHVTANAANKRRAYEDIVWALINTKEFQFND